ncbi:MAG: cysteine desulfurase, partial [Clostridia bacterium]|nr:cysteine desulfurase [Clostridia bacterium]
RVCPEAAEAAMRAMLEAYGNPSSTHTKGREAKKLLDTARKQVSDALGCKPGELYFTSCGSESDNWAIIGGAEYMMRKGRHVITSAVEHDAVRKSMEELERRGFEVTYLKPEKSGAVSVEAVENALRADTILVSLRLVKNETGAITDLPGVSARLKRKKSMAMLHTDAVQAFMKLPFTPKTLGADMISVSGHKLHAPKGIGALYISDKIKLKPYIHGGAQENGRRAGTEAMPQIAAFGEACLVAKQGFKQNMEHIASLRAMAVEKLSANIPELVLIPGGAEHILSISMPGWRSEVLMNFLEAKEIYVSRSSACKKGGRSHVLEAMGLDAKVIDGAIRIGLCRYNTAEDIEALCEALTQARNSLAHR